MKKSFIFAAAFMLLSIVAGSAAYAQLKIGHINSEEVMALMPERDSAAKVFEQYSVDLNKVMEEMQAEATKKYEAYARQQDSLTAFVKKAKEAEIMELNQKIENYRTLAQQELQKKQGELLQPIIDKVRKAIKDVAIANKYTYILDIASGSVVYFPEDESFNVLPLVKAKLGLK
jgi:outer membrane protein